MLLRLVTDFVKLSDRESYKVGDIIITSTTNEKVTQEKIMELIIGYVHHRKKSGSNTTELEKKFVSALEHCVWYWELKPAGHTRRSDNVHHKYHLIIKINIHDNN
jgi:hypothetical protein